MKLNIVDSSAWIEYFADSSHAKHFSKTIENTQNLIVPSITLFEVFKKILLTADESLALNTVAQMRQGKVIDLDLKISISAAKISKEQKIPMADSIILATAKAHNATVWTLDSDFKGLENVKYFKKS